MPPKHKAKVLAQFQAFALAGKFRLSIHGTFRGVQRTASREDCRNVFMTATSCVWQPEHESWILRGGVDLDTDELTLTAVFEPDGSVVVTVFYEEEK